MDGSFFVFLAEHQAAATFALMGVSAVGIALWRHTTSCKESRTKLHESIDANTAMLADVRERLSAVEATNQASHMKDIAAIVTAIKESKS